MDADTPMTTTPKSDKTKRLAEIDRLLDEMDPDDFDGVIGNTRRGFALKFKTPGGRGW